MKLSPLGDYTVTQTELPGAAAAVPTPALPNSLCEGNRICNVLYTNPYTDGGDQFSTVSCKNPACTDYHQVKMYSGPGSRCSGTTGVCNRPLTEFTDALGNVRCRCLNNNPSCTMEGVSRMCNNLQ